MNKTIMTFVLASVLMLSLGFVSAQQGVADGTGPYHDEVIAAGGQNGTGLKVQTGIYNAGEGKQIQVQIAENNRIKLRIGDSEAYSELNISSNGQKLMTKLSNGRNAEIKIMPNTASETALQRLRLKVCNETRNCTIELKQVGEGNQSRLAYELQTQRQSKVFGLFNSQMQVRAQIDAENGEVIQVKKPWWAFLATEPEE